MCYQSVPLPQYSGNSILNTKLTDRRITDLITCQMPGLKMKL